MSLNNQKILLETGTNEIEIMEFTISGGTFGINVAKVREIMMPYPVKPMPQANMAVEGVFKPRDEVITVIDLPKYLGFSQEGSLGRDLFIHTNFNQMHVAFRVHSVEGINRISWESIQKPDKVIYGGKDGVVTGLAECNGRLITILDFEKIVADISPETSIKLSDVEALGPRERTSKKILLAEDSALLAELILQCLHTAGFESVLRFNNGREAWDYLCTIRKSDSLKDELALIITDIEMPEMDGHRLTKLVKSDEYLKNTPVIIFSSLIDEQMREKGISVGANEQLSKPEIAQLVQAMDRLILEFDR